jgi:uncharacterized protein (TIGR02757 family)
MNNKDLKRFLDSKVTLYNQPVFISNDPISIPRQFIKKQDIEIAALFAAVLAWGNRTTIINKCNELMALMNNHPYDFILQHKEDDLKRLLHFKHRTFNTTDLLYFIHFLKDYYSNNESLENAFVDSLTKKEKDTEKALIHFHDLFFSLENAPKRTQKHIPTPLRKSTCKRMNMFLRWMVRQDNNGVDFGIWKTIRPSQLVCPIDLHVDRVARKLGLVKRKQNDWQTATELTTRLKEFDANDPVKYDFALFGLGVIEKY